MRADRVAFPESLSTHLKLGSAYLMKKMKIRK